MRINGRPSSSKTPGFTLVELLIVMVIIGVLAGVTLVAYNGIQRQARIATLQSDLTGASRALAVAKVTEGEYPVNSAASDLLEKSDGTILNYTAGTNRNSYCLTAINDDLSYRITDVDTAPSVGACMGVLADGSSCPAGYIVVPGSSTYGTSTFCAMKYIASQSGGDAVSVSGVTPWVSISQTDSIAAARDACSGCHLITEPEWLTIAQNVLSVPGNWSGGSVDSGYIYSGHSDNSPANTLAADANDANGYSGTGNSAPSDQRRTLTLTNGEVIWGLAGNAWQWTASTSTTGQPGSSGYAFREWNDLDTPGSLATNPMPSIGTPAASNWTSTEGIGQVYSSSDETALRGFFRGGDWDSYASTGVLALRVSSSPSANFDGVGFRVARGAEPKEALETPGIATSDSGIGAINVVWADIADETAYVLEYTSVSGSWPNEPIELSEDTDSRVVADLTPGTMYYFKLKATAIGNTSNKDTSNSSNVISRAAPQLDTPDIDATATGPSSINVTWSDISYETSYTLQYTTSSSSWTSPTPTTVTGVTEDSTSRAVTGLSVGITYYFRLQAVAESPSPEDTSNWSARASATTVLSAPTCSTTTLNSNTQITPDWGSATGATSYTVQYGPGNYGTEITGINTTYKALSVNSGTTYTSRVKAVAGSASSSWTNCPTRTTGVNPPVCSTTGGSSNTQIIPDWNAATGATSYTVQYGPGNYGTTISGVTGTSRTINGLNNGTTYTSRVQAVAGSTTSSWTNCPNRTTGVSGPSSSAWTVRSYAVRNSGSVTWMPGEYPGSGNYWTNGMYIRGTCSSGATVVVRLYVEWAQPNGSSARDGTWLNWTWNNQDRYVVGGSDNWYVFWKGWVACQVGSTRSSSVYLGKSGGW